MAYYNIARCHALMSKATQAVEMLRRAIARLNRRGGAIALWGLEKEWWGDHPFHENACWAIAKKESAWAISV
jgi:hypothetical protein